MNNTLLWLSEVTDRDEVIQVEDLRDGFLLLQVLSVIEPAAVDWDGYNAACERSVDPIHVNYDLLEKGARHRSDPSFCPSVVANAREGDSESLLDLASAFKMLYEKKFGKTSSATTGRSKERDVGARNSGDKTPAIVVRTYKNKPKNTVLKDSDDEEDEKEGNDYEAGEAHFKPMVRWIFQLIRQYIQEETLEKEYDLLLFLLEDPNPCIVNGKAIMPLCTGRVYQHASNVCFRRGEKNNSTEHLTSKKWTFLDDLLTKGCLSVTLIGPVRDMIADRDPFYESLHISIMEAFMRAAGSFAYPEVAAKSPRDSVHSKDVYADTSVEDRLLIWLNKSVAETATEPLEQITDLVDALSDLSLLLRVLTVVLDGGKQTHPPSRSKSTHKLSTLETFDSVKQLCRDADICFPFVPAELCKSRSRATFKPLVLDFFSRVRNAVQIRSCASNVQAKIRSGSASLKKNRKKKRNNGTSNCSEERGSKSCPNLPLITGVVPRTSQQCRDNISTAQSEGDNTGEFHLPEIEPRKTPANASLKHAMTAVCDRPKTEALPVLTAETKIRRISRRRLKEIHPVANIDTIGSTRTPANLIEQTRTSVAHLDLGEEPVRIHAFPTGQTGPTEFAVEGDMAMEAQPRRHCREEIENDNLLELPKNRPLESRRLDQELEGCDPIISQVKENELEQNDGLNLESSQAPVNIPLSNDDTSETTTTEKAALFEAEEIEIECSDHNITADAGTNVTETTEARPPSGVHQYLLQDDPEEEQSRESNGQTSQEDVTGGDVIHVTEQFKHLLSDFEEDEDETRENLIVEEETVGLADKYEVTGENIGSTEEGDRQFCKSPNTRTAVPGDSGVVDDVGEVNPTAKSTRSTDNVTTNCDDDAPIHSVYHGFISQPASEEDSIPFPDNDSEDHDEERNARESHEIPTENITKSNSSELRSDGGEDVVLEIEPEPKESNVELPIETSRPPQTRHTESLNVALKSQKSRTRSPPETPKSDTETLRDESSHISIQSQKRTPSEPPSQQPATEASDTDPNEGSVYFDVNSGRFYDRKSPKKGKQQQQIAVDHNKHSESLLVTDSAVEELDIISAYELQQPVCQLNLSDETTTANEPTRRKSEAFTILFEPSEKKKLRQLSPKGQPMRDDGRESITDVQQHQPMRRTSEAFTIILEPELKKGSRRTLIQRTTDGKDKKLQEEKLSEHQRAEEAKSREEENRKRIEEKSRLRLARRMEDQTNANDKLNAGKIIPLNPTVESATRSNRQLVRNALVHVCLAGTVNAQIKQDVLEDLDSSPGRNFVILFRGTKDHAFRALYAYDPKLEQVLKLYGTGPMTLKEADVSEYYKYDSGSRSFKTVPTKTFGISVHAVSVAGPTGGSRSAKRGKSKS